MRNFPCADKHQQQVRCRDERERLTAGASIFWSQASMAYSIAVSILLQCRSFEDATVRGAALPTQPNGQQSKILAYWHLACSVLNLTVDEAGEIVTVEGQLQGSGT
jgi:hypothetical protein